VRLHTPIAVKGRGQAIVHQAWTKAGADGEFSLTTPLPSGHVGHGFETAPQAMLLTGAGDGQLLTVTEGAVRRGETISVGASD
jgi:hypothetical protein